MHWADVFVQNGISLRSAPLALLTRTPLIIVHQAILGSGPGLDSFRERVKQLLTHLGYNIAISKPAAQPVEGIVRHIPNTFRPVFDQPKAGDDERDGLLFVGRLVSVKGADLAIEAVRRLREEGAETTLTVCGDGPDRFELEKQVRDAGLQNVVTFEGWTSPEELAVHYRQAEALLVPSRYEPFGIVALEAIASGSPVVAAQTGGLPEAVGECGLLVPPGDPAALADAVERVLRPDIRRTLSEAMPAHVDRHRIDRIAHEYLEIFYEALHAV
jgi:glycosyltransferase involved in cell wall biosynthesis